MEKLRNSCRSFYPRRDGLATRRIFQAVIRFDMTFACLLLDQNLSSEQRLVDTKIDMTTAFCGSVMTHYSG